VGKLLTVLTAGTLCVSALAGCGKGETLTAEEMLRLGDEQLGRQRGDKARGFYQQLLEEYPENRFKAEVQFKVAESLYGEGSYLEARFEYEKFLELYPQHPLAAQAQFQIGMCHAQQMNPSDRDQKVTVEALRAFRIFRRNYPQDTLLQEAEAQILSLRQRLAQHEFDVAEFYYRKEAYQAAIRRLLNLIQVYPDMSDLDSALFMLADSYRREENYVKAARVFRTLIARFSDSAYVARAVARLRDLPETGISRTPDSALQ
jgi:outer membrane protein assembly factor BamD